MTTTETEPSKAARGLLNSFDKLGVPITDGERQEIEQTIDDEAMAKAFIEMRLHSAVNPQELKKMGLLSSLMWQNIEIDPLLLTMEMYSIGHARRVLEHTDMLLDGKDQDGTKLDKNLSEEAVLGTLRLKLLGSVELSRMIVRAQKVAHSVATQAAKKGPRNRPPDSLAPPPIMVQNNGGTVNLNHEQED